MLLEDSIATADAHNHDESPGANHKTDNDEKPRASQKHGILAFKHERPGSYYHQCYATQLRRVKNFNG